jgi:hypothetical protein
MCVQQRGVSDKSWKRPRGINALVLRAEKRWHNHPRQLPRAILNALDTHDAAEPEGYDLCLFVVGHESRREFAEEWQVANNHEVTCRMLDSLFHRRDRVFRRKAAALQDSLARRDCAGEDLGGLLGSGLAAMPDGLELQAERPKESRYFLHITNAFVGEPALGIFLFGLRLSMLNKVNAHLNLDSHRPVLADASPQKVN